MAHLFRRFRKKAPEEVVIAIADYTPESSKDGITLLKGERFLLKKVSTTKSLWHLRREDDGKDVVANSNFLVKEREMEDFELISFNVTPNMADEVLADPKYEDGAFIIQTTDNFNSPSLELTMSIKVQKNANYIAFIDQRPICKENNRYCFNLHKLAFNSLTELVEHYAGKYNNDSNIHLTFSVKKNESVIPWDYEKHVHSIEKEYLIGRGCFSEIYMGKLFDKVVVAFKKPIVDRMTSEDLFREAEIARYCKHPNVLETIGVCSKQMLIITEYMANGNLKDYFERHVLSQAQCLSVAQKVASAMKYLASMNIVHRDLAARNILVGETIEIIKVFDFGYSRSLQHSRYYITQRELFPRRWTAPEAMVIFQSNFPSKEGLVTSAADIWSFGIFLWELYTNGEEPYSEIGPSNLYEELTENNYRLEKPAKCPKEIYAKMLECWRIKRKKRPDFAHIVEFLSHQTIDIDATDASPFIFTNSDTDEDTEAREILWDYKSKHIIKNDLPIGRGFFGKVYKGTLLGNRIVALKSPDLDRMDKEEFLKEAEIARDCKHPNVLKTIGICSTRPYIITQYMANGSLIDYVRMKPELSPDVCLSVATKIARGMEYLAGMNIVHRDLAARNILVGETIDTIKISDFGLSRQLDSNYYITQRDAIPRRWTAPEGIVVWNSILVEKKGRITIWADIWSYAVVLWELYTNGKIPYENISEGELLKELTENNYRLERPPKCPDEIYAKMLECWRLEKKERPTFTNICEFLKKQRSEEPAAVTSPVADEAGERR